jgi:cytochrome c oxidase cbb3-type subunit 4
VDYNVLRHFADSWGLAFMVLVFIVAVAWAFRPGSTYKRQAEMPFLHDDERDV